MITAINILLSVEKKKLNTKILSENDILSCICCEYI
jgi:hypothetical protein